MKRFFLFWRVSLAAGIWGSGLGIFAGGLVALVQGTLRGSFANSLDLPLLGGLVTGVAGAFYGALLALREPGETLEQDHPETHPPARQDQPPPLIEEDRWLRSDTSQRERKTA